ncbi:MAG TPA: hypothetical protein VIK89_12435 [Cytophagaceae bacterium]
MQQAQIPQAGLEEKIQFLTNPDSYSERPEQIKLIETHFSIVVLSGNTVLKMKKPVKTDFIDLRSFEARTFCIKEELRLNRRLAPDTYLGIIPIYHNYKGLNFRGEGEIAEWLVKMCQLPADKMLDYRIKNNTVTTEDLMHTAIILSTFYLNAKPEIVVWKNLRQRMEQEVESYKNIVNELTNKTDTARLADTIYKSLLDFIKNNSKLFEERIAEGKYIEGHGDLRPEHICLTNPPQIFDCLEFDKSLRIIDPAEELAFLAMECDFLGAAWVGQMIIDNYQKYTLDNIPSTLISFYKTKRAFLRAKLTAAHLLEQQYTQSDHWEQKAQKYIQLGHNYLLHF